MEDKLTTIITNFEDLCVSVIVCEAKVINASSER